MEGIIFQQDGAPAHTARLTVRYLQDRLEEEGAGIVIQPLVRREDDDLSQTARRTPQFIEAELARLGDNVELGRPTRLIGIRGDIEWSPRSPDLSPLDFWLWVVLKHKCFLTPPPDGEELLHRIIEECHRMERENFLTFEHVR